jgi:hypothetical protein
MPAINSKRHQLSAVQLTLHCVHCMHACTHCTVLAHLLSVEQALETIVYKVKALSEAHGIAKACKVNVLKNRHIDGSEVQEVQESEVEEEEEEVQQDEDTDAAEQEEVTYTLFTARFRIQFATKVLVKCVRVHQQRSIEIIHSTNTAALDSLVQS